MTETLHKKAVLSLQELTVSFESSANGGEPLIALNNVNLDIYEGDLILVTGENGSGKTTFFNILSGSLNPDKGFVRFYGNEKSYKATKIPYFNNVYSVFQNLEIGIVPNFTVAEYLIFRATNKFQKQGNYNQIKKQAHEFLKQYDFLHILSERFEEPIQGLSGGWKQILQIATGVYTKPDIFLLDEPLSHISKKYYAPIIQFILTNTAKVTLMINHASDFNKQQEKANRRFHFKNGNISISNTE